MKIPQLPPEMNPPGLFQLVKDSQEASQSFLRILNGSRSSSYDHWDEIRHKTPPPGFTREGWWTAIKLGRAGLLRPIPLLDKNKRPFQYSLTDPALKDLHHIDTKAGSSVHLPEEIASPETRDRFLVKSLIEEAIRSSQLEGASTTRQVAKEMIHSNRMPKDRSEQMIFNNYKAIQAIRDLKGQQLTPQIIFQLHKRLVENTLENQEDAGRLRRESDKIHVEDRVTQEILHIPPAASELPARLEAMCSFANKESRGEFVHPVVSAIILHFWLAYDHPFVDGNGRCARALFYWSMLRNDYVLSEFISISSIISQAPAQYQKAFLQTETDDNDLTYFILYHLKIVDRALVQLHSYLARKSKEIREIESQLKGSDTLNHRQRALVAHALRHPGMRYSIQSHQVSHNVVYQTARTDLLDLVKQGFLTGTKAGKNWVFRASTSIRTLSKASGSAKTKGRRTPSP